MSTTTQSRKKHTTRDSKSRAKSRAKSRPAQPQPQPSTLTAGRIIALLAAGQTPAEIVAGHPRLSIDIIKKRLATPRGRRRLAAYQALAQLRMQLMAASLGPNAVTSLANITADSGQQPAVRVRSCLGVIDVARDTAIVEPIALPAAAENPQPPRPRNEMEQAMAKAFDILAAEADRDRQERQAIVDAEERQIPVLPAGSDSTKSMHA